MLFRSERNTPLVQRLTSPQKKHTIRVHTIQQLTSIRKKHTSDPTAHKRSKETHDLCGSSRAFHRYPPLSSRHFSLYICGLAVIAISHLNSYLQPHHSSMAFTVPTLTYPETEALCASNYPCPPSYRVPAGWWLSAGGALVPPVPQGVARQH